MRRVRITIDQKEIDAAEGAPLLWVALDAGVFIPHLCAMRRGEPPQGRCRLCWVEVEGDPRPALACTLKVRAGMQVRTRDPQADRLVRSAFSLIMSHHRLDCVRCPANRRCALQEIARRRGLPLKPAGLTVRVPSGEPDESRPELVMDPGKCVLCGQCVWVCNHKVKKRVIDFSGKGMATRVSTFDGRPLASQACGDCVACARVCPVGAIYLRRTAAEQPAKAGRRSRRSGRR